MPATEPVSRRLLRKEGFILWGAIKQLGWIDGQIWRMCTIYLLAVLCACNAGNKSDLLLFDNHVVTHTNED